MKKIMMICEAFGGGVFAYVSQLCNDMSTYYKVYLVFAVRPQTPDNYTDQLDPRINLIELESFGNLANLFSISKTVRSLRKIKELLNPDLIHLHSSIAGGIGRLAFDGKDCPVVYTPHGYAHVLLGSGIKSNIYYLFEKYLGKRNAITLTCCESEDEVAKTLCKRTAYIETGVDLKKLSESLAGVKPLSNKRFTVFTLGRVCNQKQPYVFNRIAELVPEADFLWIGGGELEGELTADNLMVTGWKPRCEALAIAKSADVFVLCSLGEAIAMSLIENMFIGKLVLVSDVMGNRSVIQDGINGYVCNCPEMYAKRIREAISCFPQKLAEQAHKDVLNIYNTKRMAAKYVSFYNSCMNGEGFCE